MTDRHLAQLNVGRMTQPKGHPDVAEFFDNLERVNAVAERMPGFVWRLQDEGGDATEFRLGDDPNLLVNMSVWETPEALATYVFQTVHASFYRKRGQWFLPMDTPHACMWWVAAGHIPDLTEAARMLQDYTENGASDRVFGWPEIAADHQHLIQRCA
ncbi:MAG: DUF3291 domain-containing protein [Pseudomonadota bacterium]